MKRGGWRLHDDGLLDYSMMLMIRVVLCDDAFIDKMKMQVWEREGEIRES